MASRGNSKTRSRRQSFKAWHKRLIAGALTLLSLLVFLSLIYGKESILRDYQQLSYSGHMLSWFFQPYLQTANLIGVFGAVISYILLYLFGYWLSLLGSLLLMVVSLQYFLEPEAHHGRQKSYLLLITAFLLQILFCNPLAEYQHSVIPLFVRKVLYAVFRGPGSSIILVGGIVLSLVLFFEFRRIKQWLAFLREDFARRREARQDSAQQPRPNINPDAPPAPQPVIQNHSQPEEEPQPVPAPQKREPTPEAKPAPRPQPVSEDGEEREYVMPSIEDFLESPVKLSERDRKEIESQILETSQILQSKLAEFGIEAEVRNVNIGPIITQYELEPAKGVKVSRFTSLADDLALAIKAKSIRVQAPIPGRGLIGIEIPNLTRDMIYLRDLLLCEEIRNSKNKLVFGLGKDIAGRPVVTDLAKMPHLLIAGATGSGKSVCINTIIMSLILRATPDDLRLILIDPKRVELAGYNDLPHLIGSVVTEPESALENMYWAVKEMERRYELLQEARVRDINGYNERAALDKDLEKLPFIVIIVDEFADLIMTSGKDIELPITRLAQMARAVGIHIILATQRPSIKVITGIIKANFSARIAFQVSSRVDSRVILDTIGAERLLGSGDMLFMPPGKAIAERIHGAYVSDHEIARVCEFMSMQPKPRQEFNVTMEQEGELGVLDYDDELFPEAARVVVSANTASVSMLQRHFKIGYARAGRLIDLLERARIIGPHLGSKSRDVLATRDELIRLGLIRED
ncbi:MAG TPA: DNA translocase FtsK [Candidatus Cloacimonadota bacterium]|jgi:S-DNA-T family DNA segregation ATPase FtsK/SpoIIIE|nr:DNA translocase FtsK [Candidatus Cloacimonadota bacterium]HOG31048.1 DNA translocase FtsK [Candidatus Cloacimonadota bacterium]HOR59104.1 DNA translocase FtsK [Candidatus Cloacimonadota bacterium]HPB08855.1 DNA translocase FtsK [Candidatus Cloacimonadota bacterium]HPL23410.1 DNA translocase FtsK [Candidatus Cloacimonadota bacterium]